jgi:hypothetical protein
MSSSDDLCYLSASTLAAQIRARKVSAVEVIDAVADRLKRLNPKLNAYVTLDLENARKDAEMKHRMRKEHPDGDLGLLHGVPVAIKDDLEVAGLRFTCGSRLREKEIGKSDDLTVARLRKAGAIILGKTNEPEFGHKGTTDNKLFGTTHNPWNRERTAGGSSGGSAAAVAAHGLPGPRHRHRRVRPHPGELLRHRRAQGIVRPDPAHPGRQRLRHPVVHRTPGADRRRHRPGSAGAGRPRRPRPVLPAGAA